MYAKYFKRFFDIICSLAALIVLGIPMIIFAILIRNDLGKPVIFRQERIGKDEKKFTLYKFRSMKNAFDEYGVPLPDEERITKLGMLIRKLSIDELPSLINILKGDMSIIGPRPLPWNYKPWFKKEERKRHTVRGGLSGIAQIKGRNSLTWEEKFAYDLEYIEKITFWGDIKIILITVKKALISENIGFRSKNVVTDFHCLRSGLTEKDLIKLEEEKMLPETYEEWVKKYEKKTINA